MSVEICPKCGETYRVGEDYRCPHGAVGRGGVIDDTLTGGARWMHNLGDKPVWVETKSQFKHELATRGLVNIERSAYNKSDQTPYASRTRLRAGQRDPFIHSAK